MTLTDVLPAPPAKAQASSSSLRLLKPTTLPIPLLSSPEARNYSYVHTLVVVGYYLLRSSALVADPLPTLLQDAVSLIVLQSLFCTVCLPSAGNWFNGTNARKIIEGTASSLGKSSGTKSAGVTSGSAPSAASLRRRAVASNTSVGAATATGTERERLSGGSYSSRVMPTAFSLILTLFVSPVPLALLSLVLGAPLYPTNLLPHTFTLAVHVSLLAILPIFYTHGVSGAAWHDVSAAWLPFDEAGVWAGTVGTFVGGWIGAVPMALDWDREWQKWPCTVLWGAVLGWAVGRVLTNVLGLGVGRRIDLSVSEWREEEVNEQQQAERTEEVGKRQVNVRKKGERKA